jgi:hypothetical protein
MREKNAYRGQVPGARLTKSAPVDPFRPGFVHRRRDDDATMGKTEQLSYLIREINHS